MPDDDFYDLLGAPTGASEKELQRCFRRQAMKYHPDKNPTTEAAARFHLLSIALDTLTDDQKKLAYDEGRKQRLAAKQRREDLDADRRVAINNLEEREKLFSQTLATGQETRAQAESREEELSRQGAKLRAELSEQSRKRRRDDVTEKPIAKASQPKSAESHDRTIKVRFRGKVDRRRLEMTFSRMGEIEEIIYRPSDKRTQSALIEFTHADSAYRVSNEPVASWGDVDVQEIVWAPANYNNNNNKSSQVIHDKHSGTAKWRTTNGSTYSFKPKLQSPLDPSKCIGGEFERLILLKMQQRQKEIDSKSTIDSQIS